MRRSVRDPAWLAAVTARRAPLPPGPFQSFLAESLVGVDGDPIDQWDDTSGNARHVAQANASLQPTIATIDGRRCVHFANADVDGQAWLSNPTDYGGNFGDITVGMIVRATLVVGGRNHWMFGPCITSTTRRTAVIGELGANWSAFRTSSAVGSMTRIGPIATNVWLPICARFQGLATTFSVGDVETAGVYTGNGYCGPRIGNYAAPAALHQFFGQIAEVHVYAGDVYADLLAYLQGRV